MTAKKESKEVVNWKERLATEAKAIAQAERPDVSFISLQGGAITYNGEVVEKLDAVIVAATYERTYYKGAWEAGVTEDPDCFAQHVEESLLTPHANVPNPVNPDGCHTCPLSQWGSATTGSGKGQECKIRRKLGLLPFGSDNYADSELAVLAVTPTSGRYFSSYANKLASAAGLPPWAAGTEITTTPDPSSVFRVNFKPLGPLAEEHLGAVNARIEGAQAVLLTPYEMNRSNESEAPSEDSDKF